MKTEEMIEVMQAFVDGKAIEFRPEGSDEWGDVPKPVWDWSCFEYRIKPKVIKKLVLPWDFIDKKYNYAAIDSGGDIYLYESEPLKNKYQWYSGGENQGVGREIVIDTDGVDWEESLTERP